MSQKGRTVKTSPLLQMEATECGAVALAIVMRYYKKYIPIEQIRQECGVSRDGSKAINMIQVARKYGFEAGGFEISHLKELYQLTFPTIIFWEFNHFIVLEGILDGKFYINDPASGRRQLSAREFSHSFTGLILEISPGKSFKPSRSLEPSLLSILWQRLQGAKMGALYITLVSLLLIFPDIILPGLSKIFIDEILIKETNHWFMPLILSLFCLGMVRGFLKWLQQLHLLKLQVKLNATSSSSFLWYLLHLPMNFFYQRYVGDIVERMMANERISGLLSLESSASTVGILQVGFFGIAIFLLSWKLALISVAGVALSVLLLQKVTRGIEEINKQFLKDQSFLSGLQMNGLRIIETLKSTSQESIFFSRWRTAHAKTINSQQKAMFYNQLLIIGPNLIFGVTVIAVLGTGSLSIMQGQLTVGTLIAFQMIMLKFYTPILALLGTAEKLQLAKGDVSRLEDVLYYPIDQRFGSSTTVENKGDTHKLKGKIELKKIAFSYSLNGRIVLNNISFTIPEGSWQGIVGLSGSGKSTLVKIICGLYHPSAGEILYDGLPMKSISSKRLTHSFAIVNTASNFLEGTLRENLALWKKDHTDEALLQALEVVDLKEMVLQRGGLDAKVHENGSNFSGGQRQRLEIARAILRKPSILILDEATASLDLKTERSLFQKLKQYKITTIIISHRLSTLEKCDNIVVIDQGVIAAQGTSQALIKSNKLYAQLILEE